MNPLEFEEKIKPLNRRKYHINRTIAFTNDNVPYIDEWSIFRQDMPAQEFFSAGNEAVLASYKGNTIEDIEELIAKEQRHKTYTYVLKIETSEKPSEEKLSEIVRFALDELNCYEITLRNKEEY